jgi:hypothetical protein
VLKMIQDGVRNLDLVEHGEPVRPRSHASYSRHDASGGEAKVGTGPLAPDSTGRCIPAERSDHHKQLSASSCVEALCKFWPQPGRRQGSIFFRAQIRLRGGLYICNSEKRRLVHGLMDGLSRCSTGQLSKV